MKRKSDNAAAPRRIVPLALWLSFALAFVTFLAYARLPTHGFTWWDDQQTLHANPDFNPPSLDRIARYWTEPEAGLYAPVTYTVWGMLSFVAYDRFNPTGIRLNAGLFHFASILVHIGSALLVMSLLRRLLENDHGRAGRDEDRTAWAAFAGALLYALHPVQVESVAWASGMKDLLFGFFSLLALWQYTRWAQRSLDHGGERGVLRPYILALLAAVLAMLSKPTAVVIPIAAFIIDYWLVRRPLRNVAASLVPFLLLAAATALIARAVQPASHLPAPPFWTRPLIAGDALAFYLYKLLLPIGLAVDYGHRPSAVLGHWAIYVTWLIPAILAISAWRLRRNHPQLLAAALLFAAGLLPVLGFLPFEFQGYSTVADHYLYLSMLGPSLALGWLLRRYASGRLAITLLLALFWLQTMLQTRHWRDDGTLWTHTLHVNPRSFLAYTNLGFWHDLHRRHDRATEMYREAVKITDDYVNARAMYSLANNLLRAEKYDEAAAWYQKFIETTMPVPTAARTVAPLEQAYLRMGRALAASGRNQEARAAFTRALELNPGLAEAAEGLKKL